MKVSYPKCGVDPGGLPRELGSGGSGGGTVFGSCSQSQDKPESEDEFRDKVN